MKIQLFLAFITISLTLCLNDTYYENYDDDPLEDLELDDEMDSDLNVIGRGDELRQIILNPRKRRERRRKHQGKFSKKKKNY